MRKIKFLIFVVVAMCGVLVSEEVGAIGEATVNEARGETVEQCPAVEFVFARGSGGARWEDQNYLTFKDAIESRVAGTGLDYEFLDLDYPAIGVGFDNLFVTLGAFFGRGDAYEFGASVDAGVAELARVVNRSCPGTKFVVAGYSQGAMVVSKALHSLDAEKIIYAAAFGDPKIYLPEGAGLFPAACRNLNLSEYRAYVPDCYAYVGLLGSYRPYQPEGFSGKFGTFCNTHDIFCSSHLSVSSHVSYVADNLYERAGETIAEKVRAEFGLPEVEEKRGIDAAFIVTDDQRYAGAGNWNGLQTAKKYAEEIVRRGGRAAVYDFTTNRLGQDELKLRCRMGNCYNSGAGELPLGGTTLESFTTQSLTGVIERVVREAGWSEENEKVVVVLGRHFLGANVEQGIAKIAEAEHGLGVKIFTGMDFSGYSEATARELAADFRKMTRTFGGASYVVGEEEWEEKLFAKILAVESEAQGMPVTRKARSAKSSETRLDEAGLVGEVGETLPEISEVTVEMVDFETARVGFSNSGEKVIVILNEAILGMSDSCEITIGELDRTVENRIRLVAVSSTRRGYGTEVVVPAVTESGSSSDGEGSSVVIPKAPNTGRAQ